MIGFNSFALLVPACLYFALGFVPKEYPWVAVVMTLSIQICTGANCGGYYKCGTLVAR
jgi:MFS transporter, ACS family, solute carrier family 17 (sodium-dependent inorganic phosphate cotransporter), member 5